MAHVKRVFVPGIGQIIAEPNEVVGVSLIEPTGQQVNINGGIMFFPLEKQTVRTGPDGEVPSFAGIDAALRMYQFFAQSQKAQNKPTLGYSVAPMCIRIPMVRDPNTNAVLARGGDSSQDEALPEAPDATDLTPGDCALRETRKLADYLMSIGGPQKNESAADMAIRLLKADRDMKSSQKDAGQDDYVPQGDMVG